MPDRLKPTRAWAVTAEGEIVEDQFHHMNAFSDYPSTRKSVFPEESIAEVVVVPAEDWDEVQRQNLLLGRAMRLISLANDYACFLRGVGNADMQSPAEAILREWREAGKFKALPVPE